MLTQKRLKELLKYSKKTGLFTRLINAGTSNKIGRIAGWLDKDTGYIRIGIDGKNYQAHRLAYLYVKGYFPEHDIDHKRGNRADNRWKSIRHVTRSCNMQNSAKRIDNSSGFKGVFFNKRHGKHETYININNKRIYLGVYVDALEAAVVRLEYEIQCLDWHCDIRQESTKKVLKALKKDGQKKLAKKLKKQLMEKLSNERII